MCYVSVLFISSLLMIILIIGMDRSSVVLHKSRAWILLSVGTTEWDYSVKLFASISMTDWKILCSFAFQVHISLTNKSNSRYHKKPLQSTQQVLHLMSPSRVEMNLFFSRNRLLILNRFWGALSLSFSTKQKWNRYSK